MELYKKIFKNPATRKFILNCLRFVPDSLMLKMQYRIKLHRSLNLKNPKRFTEKIQWYKINYRNPIMHQCVDKFNVREFLKNKGLENILIPLIGKYESIQDVNFDKLPDSFVIKTTHGGGGLNVVICQDKSKLKIEEIKEKLYFQPNKTKKMSMGREWAYIGLVPGIVVEELLVNKENPEAGVNDYKIFCYNGKPEYLVVDVDRYIGHKRNFYKADWTRMDVSSDCPQADKDIPKPENFEKMLSIASKLSSDFPFVRVDLYNVNGKIYFGELTFYPWSGYVQFTPDDIDFELGNDLPLIKR